HRRGNRSAEFGERPDVEIDHLPLALGVELGEAADQPEPSIIDEEANNLAVRLDVGHQLGGCIALRQVYCDRPRVAQLLCELLQPVLAPGNEDKPVPAPRQLACELDSKP